MIKKIYIRTKTPFCISSIRKRPGHGKGKKGKMGIKDKMIVMAHCAHANKGDETRQGDCKKCFMNAVKPSRNPRARVNAKEAILTAVTGCSEEFLAPVYDKCTTMLKDKTSEKKGVHECYIRLLVTELVQTCSNGITEVKDRYRTLGKREPNLKPN